MAKTRGTLKFYDMNSPEIEATTAGQQTEYKGRKGRGTLTFTEIEPIPMPETTVKPEAEEDAASGGGAQKDNKKFDAGQYAGDAGRLFLNGVAEGFAATGAAVENWIGKGLDKLFPGAGFEGSGLFNVLYNGRPDWKWAGENGLVGIKQDREYNQESLQENADRIDSKVLKKAAEFGGDIAYGLGNAAPMAATAMATGGASAAASLTKEGLMKTGAEVVEKSGALNSLSQAAREMLTSQDYWTSFASEVGMDYYDALDNGATEDEALRYALSSAGLNSVIEIGGGIQKIPEKPTFKTWLKSAHEEGMEEIQQGVVSRLLENVVYKKGNPIASVTDENAVFNPVTALGEYAGGAAVGGILSGGQQLAQRGINDAQYRKAYGNNAQALVDESLELNPDNELAKKAQKKLDAGKKLTGSELRQLVEQNETDVMDGDRATIQTAVEDRLTELGETENVPQVAEAIARQAAGERISDAEKTLLEGSERARQVRQELNPENIRVGATDEAWTGQIGTERINRAAYNRGIQENGVTGAKYNAETGKLDAIVKDDQGKIQTVPAEKAELSLLQEELFDWAADLGEAGPVLVSAYRQTQNLETYARQFHNAYEYGKAGVPMDYVNKSQAVSYLNTTQREIAYEEGAKAHQRELQGRKEKKRPGGTVVDSSTQKKPTVSLRGATVGGVKYAPVNKKAMDGRQWASVGIMKAFAQAAGVNVVFYESQANERGEYEGANGFYKDGTLYLDINAGRDRVAMGETAILKTAAHEITHYIKEGSPEQYEVLKNFVVSKLTREKGISFDDLVTDKQRREPGLSYEEAVDEVVADACEMMLKDSKAVEQLARENRSLAERIRQWIRKWVRSLKAAMEGLTANRPESRAMMQYAQELQEIWDNALVDAARNARGTMRENAPAEVKQQARVGTDEKSRTPIYQSNFPKGTPKAEKAQRILSLIQNVWSKKPISLVVQNADGSTRTIEAKFDPTYIEEEGVQTDAKKLMGGNRHGSASEQRVTLDLADDYYEIAAESTYNYSKSEMGKTSPTHKGVKQWHYFINDILFQEYGEKETTPYRVTINVKERSDGEFVYSFSAERQNERLSTRRTLHADDTQSARGGESNAQPSVDSIRQGNANSQVKSNDKVQNSMRDSVGRELTEAQQEYFKDSKVRDREGRLKPVYHGSASQFTKFSADFMSQNGSSEGQGFYFTDLKTMAEGYEKNGGQLLEGYLDIENPLSDSKVTLTEEEVKRLITAIDPTGDDLVLNYDSRGGMGYPSRAWYNRAVNDTLRATMKTSESDSEILAELANGMGDPGAVLKGAREVLGYDGYIVEGKYDNATVYVAFDSSQFKNIDNRTPTKDPDIRYSMREQFPSELDQWDRDGRPEGERFTLGSTGPVLQGLGAIESDIYMEGDKISTILKDHPEMTLAEIKKIPQILEDPALVLKSKTRKSSIVVLGTYRAQNGKPILAAMDLRPTENGFAITDMQKVASAYTKTGSQYGTAEEVGRHFLETSDVLFLDKKRATAVLRPMGILAPMELLRNGYVGSISYKDGFVNSKGLPFSSVVKISEETTQADRTEVTVRNQQREPRLSDRAVLRMAAEMALRDKSKSWTAEDREQLERFRNRMRMLQDTQAELEALKEERKILLAGRKVSEIKGEERTELTKNKNRIDIAKNKAERYEAAVWELESKAAIKTLLKKSRSIVEADAAFKARRRYREKAEARQDYMILRKRLEHTTSEWKRMLLRPTKDRYAPEELVRSCLEVAAMLDESGPKEGTKSKEKYKTASEALAYMKRQYDALGESDDQFYRLGYDKELSELVEQLRDALNGKAIRDLTYQEAGDVAQVLVSMQGILKDARYQIGSRERKSTQEMVDGAVKQMQNLPKRTKAEAATDAVARQTASVMRNVRRMCQYDDNAALYKLFRQMEEGVKKKDRFIMESNKIFDRFAGERMRKSSTETKIYRLSGKEVRMTEMEVMELILAARRELTDKTNHLNGKGFIIPDLELMRKGKVEDAIAKGTEVGKTSLGTILELENGLDAWAKDYMNTASEFFNGMARNAINDAEVQTKHRRVAMTKNYVPYEVDRRTVQKDVEGVKYNKASIESDGMLKSVKDDAQNALIIRGLDTVVENHIERVGRIYGLAVPIRNFNKAYNARSEKGLGMSMKEAISRTYPAADVKLIEQAVTDLQTSRERATDDLSRLLRKAEGKFVEATLLSNISVTIKQAASYSTAGLYLSQKALFPYQTTIAKLFAKNNSSFAENLFKEIDEHTSMHYMRRKGMSMEEAAMIAQDSSKVVRWMDKKLPDAANPLKWIQNMDVATTAALWLATKKQVELDGVKQSDPTYWNRVTELYEKVISETQPMYDSLHRPEVQKSTNEVLRGLMMFRTQPLQNAGILYDAAGEAAQAKKSGNQEQIKAANRKLRMAITSQIASLAVFSTMTLLAYAVRNRMGRYRDDEEELTVESVMMRVLGDMAVNGAQLIAPIGGGVVAGGIEKWITGSSYGGELSIPTIDAINDWVSQMDKVRQDIVKLSEDEEADIVTDSVDFAMESAGMLGIPAKNAFGILRGIVGNITDTTGHKLDWATDEPEPSTAIAKACFENGHMEKGRETINQVIALKMEAGKEKKEARAAVRSSLTAYYKKLYLKAYKRNNGDEMLRIRKAMQASGMYDEGVGDTVSAWVKKWAEEEKKK